MVKRKSLDERSFMSADRKKEYGKKLKELTDASNLPEYMGELFLSEIKLSTDEANCHLRIRVQVLGLMEGNEDMSDELYAWHSLSEKEKNRTIEYLKILRAYNKKPESVGKRARVWVKNNADCPTWLVPLFILREQDLFLQDAVN